LPNESTNTTKYNSVQLNAEKRFGKGLAVVTSYTYFTGIFNNVNFNAPNSVVTAAQFGRITSALDPRILQFGVKLLF
jgi:hypothetical protein